MTVTVVTFRNVCDGQYAPVERHLRGVKDPETECTWMLHYTYVFCPILWFRTSVSVGEIQCWAKLWVVSHMKQIQPMSYVLTAYNLC